MAKARIASSIFNHLTKGLRVDGALDMGQVALRVVPDTVFGGLAAVQTPGDLGDKLIAGTTSAVGGTLGGLALGGIPRNPIAGIALDTAGSYGGDFLGYKAGDALMRAKDKLAGGKGQTPYERMSERDQKIFAERLRRQIMAQYGIVPGTREQYAGMD